MYDGTRSGEIIGLPFMIVKYDRISSQIVDVKFGLYKLQKQEVKSILHLVDDPESKATTIK